MAIREKSLVTLSVTAKCPSHAKADISVRDVSFTIDEPVARGGSNAGPTPTDTALAALVGCTNVIAHKCASALEIDIGHLDIEAQCKFDRRGVTLVEEVDVPFHSIALTVRADGAASQEDLDRVANEVRKFCPIAKLFRGAGTELNESWLRA